MNDLDLVRQIRAGVPPPTDTRLAPGRARLLASISRECGLPAAPPRRRRRALVAAAAAGILAAGGVSYGLTAGLNGRSAPAAAANPDGSATAGLTAVSGCPGLDAASGRLVKVTGTSLILKTIRNGHPATVTVTTSAPTQVNRQVTGSAKDITDGERVYVRGTGSHGTIAAQFINLNVNLTKLPSGHGRPQHHRPPFSGPALGTVTDARDGHFSVVMALSGARVPVTTSSSTAIFTLVPTHVSQLRTAGFTDAVGRAGPDGTLAASAVAQGVYLPRLGAGQTGKAIPGGASLGCSAPAVATAFLPTR